MQFGKDKFIEQAHEIADDVRSATTEALNEAKDKAGPALAETREKAAPLLAEAKERAQEAQEAGAAKLAELRGEEPEPKKGSWVKRILIVTGLAGIGALVYKKTQGKQEANWQSSYQPAPSSSGSPASSGTPASSAAPTSQGSPASSAPSSSTSGADSDAKDGDAKDGDAKDGEQQDGETTDASAEQKPEGNAS